jgi:hypothetical protein
MNKSIVIPSGEPVLSVAEREGPLTFASAPRENLFVRYPDE